MRSLARSVRSSASVKSVVNQPVIATPSMTFVVRRAANSGWSATFVVGADLGLVARDELVVLRRDEVGLDEVGAHARGQGVARERVLGPVAGGAAVADDDGLPAGGGHAVSGAVAAAGAGRAGDRGGQEQEERQRGAGGPRDVRGAKGHGCAANQTAAVAWVTGR